MMTLFVLVMSLRRLLCHCPHEGTRVRLCFRSERRSSHNAARKCTIGGAVMVLTLVISEMIFGPALETKMGNNQSYRYINKENIWLM